MERTITIRGVPDDTLARLRAQASANRRSLNSELLVLLEERARAGGGEHPVEHRNSDAGDVAYATHTRGTTFVAEPAAKTAAEPWQVDAAELAAVCRRHGIRWLAPFGSRAEGRARPYSDVDVLVEWEPGRTPGYGFVRAAEALRPLWRGASVDLHTPRSLPAHVREQVMRSARTLYGDR